MPRRLFVGFTPDFDQLGDSWASIEESWQGGEAVHPLNFETFTGLERLDSSIADSIKLVRHRCKYFRVVEGASSRAGSTLTGKSFLYKVVYGATRRIAHPLANSCESCHHHRRISLAKASSDIENRKKFNQYHPELVHGALRWCPRFPMTVEV